MIESKQPRPHRMTMEERKTLLTLAGGDERTFPVLFLLCKLPYKRKGEVFRYMLRRGIVGNNLFVLWERNKRSPFRVYKAILDKMDGQMSTPLSVKDLI